MCYNSNITSMYLLDFDREFFRNSDSEMENENDDTHLLLSRSNQITHRKALDSGSAIYLGRIIILWLWGALHWSLLQKPWWGTKQLFEIQTSLHCSPVTIHQAGKYSKKKINNTRLYTEPFKINNLNKLSSFSLSFPAHHEWKWTCTLFFRFLLYGELFPLH